MLRSRINKTLTCGAVVMIAAALTGCPVFEWHTYSDSPHTLTNAMERGETLTVRGKVGDVSVNGWDEDIVSVTYTKHVSITNQYPWYWFDPTPFFSDIGVSLEVSGNTPGLTLAVTMPTADYAVSRSVDLDIKAPSNVVLDISNNVGDVAVAGVYGVIDVRNTVGGVEVAYPILPGEEDAIQCNTGVGDIGVLLPEDSSFVCDAETSIGFIHVFDFWPDLRPQRWNMVGARCSGTVGGGGAAVTLQAGTGDISIQVDY